MKPITQEWIDKAESDFSVAQLLAGQEKPSYDHNCFRPLLEKHPYGSPQPLHDCEK